MKTYIGIKIVEADRPNRTAADNPSGLDPANDGYRVRYADGYESWSPAKAFEEAYVEVPADRAEGICGALREMLGHEVVEQKQALFAKLAFTKLLANRGLPPIESTDFDDILAEFGSRIDAAKEAQPFTGDDIATQSAA